MKRILAIIIWSMLVVIGACLGQNALSTAPKLLHLSPSMGLSQASVHDLTQDYLGLMWIGTSEGLNKYDGINFYVYKNNEDNPQSISHNRIQKIFEDSQNRFWVATPNGLNLLDRSINGFQVLQHEASNPNSLSDDDVTDIIEDEQGRLWVSTGHPEYSLQFFQPNKKSFTSFPNTRIKSPIVQMLDNKQGKLLLAYLNGAFTTFDLATLSFDTSIVHTPKDIQAFYLDDDHTVWAGMDEGGLLKTDANFQNWELYNTSREDIGQFGSNVIWDFVAADDGGLWIATDNGLMHLNAERTKFSTLSNDHLHPNSPSSNFLISLFKDRDERIWIGTNDAGVSILDKSIQKFQHHFNIKGDAQSLSNNSVWGFHEDRDKKIWIGTSNGLNRFDPFTGTMEHFFHNPTNRNSISHNRVWHISAKSRDEIWLGTSGGLDIMTRSGNAPPRFRHYAHNPNDPNSISSNSVRHVLSDRKGNIWVATSNGGLNRFDEQTGTFKHYRSDPAQPTSISGDRVILSYQDVSGRLWIGTTTGLNLYNYEQDNFQVIRPIEGDTNSLNNGHIRAIMEDRDGRLWIGTNNGLHQVLNPKERDPTKFRFKQYTEKDGLPNNWIYAIEEDPVGYLWISTNQGLTRFSPDREVFRNYGYGDGLQSKEFNQNASFKTATGTMYFGGINGFNVFDPLKVWDDQEPPKIVFTDFKIQYNDVPIGPNQKLEAHINVAKEINLAHTDKHFSVSFAALNYTQAQKNQYAYRLLPFELKWNQVGNQNSAIYTNLEPGEYTLEVKAANHDGYWNELGNSIDINIHPALWQTWGFRLAALACLFLLAFTLYRWRLQSVLKSRQALEEKVKERTLQLQQQKEALETTLGDLKKAQAQLVQQEKMASLGQLTAGIAHEINNPVNFISSSIQALKLDFAELNPILTQIISLQQTDTNQSDKSTTSVQPNADAKFLQQEMADLMDSIERGAMRTQNIVKSLQSFSRNTAEEFVPADIHEGIDSTLLILSSQIKDRINVHKNFGSIPMVRCQINKLNQVFLNIINNAIQAIEKDGDIFISTQKIDDRIEIAIRDTGVGMEPQVLKRAFEPFYTTKNIGNGTGLGLAISYGIIKDHHGEINIDSTVGKGTTFYIRIPFR